MAKYDDRGHQVTTYEGFTGYVAPEINEYFKEQYFAQEIRVVPGHWPSMETKEDVDKWIDFLKLIDNIFDEAFDDKEDDL